MLPASWNALSTASCRSGRHGPTVRINADSKVGAVELLAPFLIHVVDLFLDQTWKSPHWECMSLASLRSAGGRRFTPNWTNDRERERDFQAADRNPGQFENIHLGV